MWSKQKKRIESFFVPEVKGRVELRTTSYRGAHDQEGRGYITIDKKEVWSMCTISYRSRIADLKGELYHEGINKDELQKTIEKKLEEDGVYSQDDFYNMLNEYENNSIEDNLASRHLLIRCLALLDYRVGKRRLKAIDLEHMHKMEKLFLGVRVNSPNIFSTRKS